MSSGGSSRVSIPSSLKKTIQDIKEIARNHSDDEILAMLEECAMDPNETAQKLLYQDTFHEVKRKRDRRKENMNNREPTDSRWKPGMQGRGIRGGRGSYYSRYQSHDAGDISGGKEDRAIQAMEKATTSPSSYSMQETENKSGVFAASSVPGTVDHSMKAHATSSQGSGTQMPGGGNFSLGEESLSASSTNSGCPHPQPVETISPANTVGIAQRQHTPKSDQFPSTAATPDSGVCADSDALLVSSLDTQASGVGHTTKYEVEGQITAAEPVNDKVLSHEVTDSEISNLRISQEMVSTSKQGLMAAKSQILEVSHLSDASQSLSSAFQSGTQGSKPSSNFSSRAQGPQKVGLSKEWKPKSLNSIPVQTSITVGMSDAAHVKVESDAQSGPLLNSRTSGEALVDLQKKLEELCFSDSEHVIIPDHLQVPEAERCGLSFGSFDASFGIGKRSAFSNDADGEKSTTLPTELSQEHEDNRGEPILSTQVPPSANQEEQYPEHHPETSSQMPDSPSNNEGDNSLNSCVVSDFEQPNEASGVAEGGAQFSVVHTAPAYSAFGLVPPMLGSQLAPFESSESQAREASRVASFILQPPFDPSTGYYTQVYRPAADGDGRFSPLLVHGATAKYGGNTNQTGQSTQENVNPLVLPNTGVTTQAGGVMQATVPVTQQPIPVFRQPAGVHMSPYPPNYVPYGHYISPFYVPTPTIHHFFGNTALSQQPLPGSIYPPPAAVTTTPVKYSLSQYKGGNNSGNSNHSVMPTGYGPYSSSPTGYGPSPTVSGGNSTVNEDHTVSQYKENNVYMTGQQSEGSPVWLPAPGREIPSVQAGSFYNLPQGQQVTFTSQAGNGAFAGIYHPTQAVGAATVHPLLQPSQTMAGAVEMVGAAAGVYQQPQRAQINWPNNY